MTIWGLTFVISTALAAAGFVVVAVLWLKKLRETLAIALGETAGQQIRSSQRLGEALSQLQRQQQLDEQNIQTLIEANIRLRQELNALASRLELSEQDQPRPLSHKVLH